MTLPQYGKMTNIAEIVDSAIEILAEVSVADDVTYQMVAKIISIWEDDRAQTERESKVSYINILKKLILSKQNIYNDQ